MYQLILLILTRLLFPLVMIFPISLLADENSHVQNVSSKGVVSKQVEYYPTDGVLLGQGWDFLSGEKTNSICVKGKPLPLKNNETSGSYSLVFDAEQVNEKMNASAKLTYGGMGYSASISSSLKNSKLDDRSKTYIFGNIETKKGGQYLFVSDNKIPKDRSKCGDGYVSAIINGGQLSILFSLDKSFQEFSKELNIDASGGGYGTGFSISFSQSLINTLKNESTKITMFQKAGEQTLPLTSDSVFAKINQYSTFTPEQSVPYKVVITPYSQSESDVDYLVLKSYYFAYVRMKDLVNTYESAIVQPLAFYTPFQKDSQALINEAQTLRSATNCMGIVLAACISGGGKDCLFSRRYNSLNEMNNLLGNNLCNNLFSNEMNILGDNGLQKSEWYSLITYQAIPKNYESFKLTSNKKDLHSTEIENNKDGKTSSKESDVGNENYSPILTYLKLYAAAPLPRNIVEIKDKTHTTYQPGKGDFMNEVNSYCNQFYTGCEINPADYTNKKMLKSIIREWVLNIKIFPLTSSFCQQSYNNPLCVNAEKLSSVVPDINSITVDENSNFTYKPTIIIQEHDSKPPYGGEDECIRHGPHYCNISR